MKRSRPIDEKLPELPVELWNLIVLQTPVYTSDTLIDSEKLKCWTRISLLNKSFRAMFLELISTDAGLKALFPVFPKGMPSFESFVREMKFHNHRSCPRGNIVTWLEIATLSERYHHFSQVDKWITPIESFTEFFKPIRNYYGINTKTYGGQLNKLVTKVGEKWDKSRFDATKKVRILFLLDKMLRKYKKKPLPTIKAPSENTKFDCLMVYRKEWREDGEKNGKRGKVYSDTASGGKKLYMGAFKPLMATGTKEGDVIYHFQFQQYDGDNLRHYNALRECSQRLNTLLGAMKEIKSLLHVRKTSHAK